MTVTPYLTFNGNCEQAFEFYAKVLGANILMMGRYKEMPPQEGQPGLPEGFGEKIMHARLEIGGQWLMASDCPPHMPYQGMHGVSIALGFDKVADAERVFAALSEGGSVHMPIAETFWAERFGMFTDKFGVAWMINGAEKRPNP
jgi:PhnB protein